MWYSIFSKLSRNLENRSKLPCFKGRILAIKGVGGQSKSNKKGKFVMKILFLRYCCNPCDPSLGSLEDISPAQICILCRPHFPCFLPFLSCYLVSKCNIHFFILVFFSCLLLSLSSTFYLSPLSFFSYPLLSLSVFLVCLLLSFLLPSIFPLWLFLFIF